MEMALNTQHYICDSRFGRRAVEKEEDSKSELEKGYFVASTEPEKSCKKNHTILFKKMIMTCM